MEEIGTMRDDVQILNLKATNQGQQGSITYQARANVIFHTPGSIIALFLDNRTKSILTNPKVLRVHLLHQWSNRENTHIFPLRGTMDTPPIQKVKPLR